MEFNKKAISPVVATALLLVVAVVAVVGFQTWFNTYQSGLNTKVEQQSVAGSVVTIERLENGTTAVVYLKNAGTSDIATPTVKISPKSPYTGTCTDNSTATLSQSAVTQVNLACTGMTVGGVYNVVVTTSTGVYSGEAIAR